MYKITVSTQFKSPQLMHFKVSAAQEEHSIEKFALAVFVSCIVKNSGYRTIASVAK